jgi:general secretion pathway protein I
LSPSGRAVRGSSRPLGVKRVLRRGRGFSLLEVIVAIAILGLGLTTILSAQAGLFSTSTRGANMTRASNLARCKMSEIEVKMMRDGFPLTDLKDDGHCCEREDDDGFNCKWQIETIKLPNMNQGDGGTDGGMFGGVTGSGLNLGGFLKMDGGFSPTNTSGLNSFGLLGQAMPGMGMGSSSDSSGGTSKGPGLGGLASMALTMVYPTIKPMYEASIRRVSVTVRWHEGLSERTFDIAQYLTNPQQGGMLPGMPGFMGDAGALGGLLGLGTTGTATGTTGSNTATTGATK